ncbi:YIP1 family protein [Bacillus gobiensis]|uniref:YIP1 family protein n=1 Tax=Bacillus gobiensis TaxID=1441095 RepID=UPI003D22AAED
MEILRIGKSLFMPKVILQEKFEQENITSLVFYLSLISAIFAVVSISVFDIEDISKVLGVTSIDLSLYKAYKIFMLLGSGILAFFTPTIITLINTIFNFLLLWILQTSISFKKLFIIGMYAYVPLLIDVLVRIFIEFIVSDPVFQSPARIFFFLPDSDNLIIKGLSTITLFTIWSIVIYSIGVSMEVPKNKQKRAILVLVITNVLIIFTTTFIDQHN